MTITIQVRLLTSNYFGETVMEEIHRQHPELGLHVEPFSGVEIHMEMDMDWKWMEMGHNLWKCYGLVWI